MGKLISGKEALIALANGEGVEYRNANGWSILTSMSVNLILNDNFAFRLKPRTIALNGVEVPSPIKDFESFMKDREDIRNFFVYYLDSSNPVNGYSSIRLRDLRPDILNSSMWKNIKVWAVEEEIKQVVAALREVFK